MLPNTLFGVTSVLCFCLPVFTILYYRLYRHTSLIALLIYYVLTILRCAGSQTMPPSPDFRNAWEVLYNYIEIPLMLSALLFFCPVRQKKQKIHYLLTFLLAYETVIALLFGFTPRASLYVMTPGLLVVVLYSLFLFLRQLRFTLQHGKNAGRVLMLTAIVVSYSFYLFLFYTYFVLNVTDVSGIYALHFVSSSITALLMSAGLFLMRHRIKELQELKVTRRELQIVFGS